MQSGRGSVFMTDGSGISWSAGAVRFSRRRRKRAADALREYIRQTGLSVYDEKTRKGRLRQMIVRTGHASREVMVTLIVNGRKLPKTDLLTDLMFQAIDSLNDEIEERLKKAAEEQGLDSYADVETEENSTS